MYKEFILFPLCFIKLPSQPLRQCTAEQSHTCLSGTDFQNFSSCKSESLWPLRQLPTPLFPLGARQFTCLWIRSLKITLTRVSVWCFPRSGWLIALTNKSQKLHVVVEVSFSVCIRTRYASKCVHGWSVWRSVYCGPLREELRPSANLG